MLRTDLVYGVVEVAYDLDHVGKSCSTVGNNCFHLILKLLNTTQHVLKKNGRLQVRALT